MKRFSKSTKNPRRGVWVLEMGCEACQKRGSGDKEKWVANQMTATRPSNSKIRIEETLLRLWYRL